MRCGKCAGYHDTRQCQENSTSCVNCGKGHHSWQKKLCRTFESYRSFMQRLGIDQYCLSTNIRAGSATLAGSTQQTAHPPPSQTRPTAEAAQESQGDFIIVGSRKRPRRTSPNPKRGPARPLTTPATAEPWYQTQMQLAPKTNKPNQNVPNSQEAAATQIPQLTPQTQSQDTVQYEVPNNLHG
jgi:hypothetical protein